MLANGPGRGTNIIGRFADGVAMKRLATAVGNVKLEKPGLVAAGILDETGPSMARMFSEGAGAVVSKSIGSVAKGGHANPNFIETGCWTMNAMGLPNPGIDAFAEEMEVATAAGKVVGSVYASSPGEFATLAGKMEDYGATAVELNLSCPHASGFGMEMGTDPAMVESIVRAVKDALSIPVWAKLTPNTHILTSIGKAVEDGGGDAIVAINTVKAMHIVPEFAKPYLSNRFGGLSGKAIKPVGVRAVYELRSATSIPIVGVGGICCHRDALEYIMAGACAFQIGSAISEKGPGIFRDINAGLIAFMEEYGYRSIKDMEGAAHE